MKPKTISKLLQLFPEIKDVTQKKHKKNGTVVLLDKDENRKYYIYKSGFAKAVNADYHNKTDFINAWVCDWSSCYSYPKNVLISFVYDYIKNHKRFKRMAILSYNTERKKEQEKVWSSIRNCWINRDDSIHE